MALWLTVLFLMACGRKTPIQELDAGAKPILATNFTSADFDQSWVMTTMKKSAVKDTLTNFEEGAVSIKFPYVVQSPVFDVQPLTYYRLDFDASTHVKSFWAVVFYDEFGQKLLADVYSSFDPVDQSRRHTFYFQSKANASTAQFWIRPNGDGSEVNLTSVDDRNSELVRSCLCFDPIGGSILAAHRSGKDYT